VIFRVKPESCKDTFCCALPGLAACGSGKFQGRPAKGVLYMYNLLSSFFYMNIREADKLGARRK
jgi:hypothetical protein